MKTFLLSLLLTPAAAFAAQPFIIFAADAAYTDSAVAPVISKYLSQTDYLGAKAVTNVPALRGVVQADHHVLMSPSLSDLNEDLVRNQTSSGDIVFYY